MFVTSAHEMKTGHHRNGWPLFTKIALTLTLLLVCLPAYRASAVTLSCTCDGSEGYAYTSYDANSHIKECQDCGKRGTEAHNYDASYSLFICKDCGYNRCPHNMSGNKCTICGLICNDHYYSWTTGVCVFCGTKCADHQITFAPSAKYCNGTCATCNAVTGSVAHKFKGAITADGLVAAQCQICGYFTEDIVEGPDLNIEYDTNFSLETYAWSVYRLLCIIAFPCAIISFASCGFTFLGAVFFGNVAAANGGDIQKAKKQFFTTVFAMAVMILLPYIFEFAIAYFKVSAWEP